MAKKIKEGYEQVKVRYESALVEAIKTSNISNYKKEVMKKPEFIMMMNFKERAAFNFEKRWDDFNHYQILALYTKSLSFFNEAFAFLMNQKIKLTAENKVHVLTLILKNRNKKLFISHEFLENLFSLDILFTRTHLAPFHHKLSFLAALRQQGKINPEAYNLFFDSLYDDSFKKIYPIYSSFLVSEIKHMPLVQGLTHNSKKESALPWLIYPTIEEVAKAFSLRKSKKVKEMIKEFCLDSSLDGEGYQFIKFLSKINKCENEVFYWALDWYPYLSVGLNLHVPDFTNLVQRFHMFQQDYSVAVTQRRIEKLFNLSKDILRKDFTNEAIPESEYTSEQGEAYTGVDIDEDFDDIEHSVSFSDMLTMMDSVHTAGIKYNIKDFKNSEEFHDFLNRELLKLTTENRALNQVEIMALHNKEFEGYTIKVPQFSHELNEVGSQLRICVGTAGYDQQVINKSTSIIFLMKEDKVEGCVEFYNREVIQMKQQRNQNFSMVLIDKFAQTLTYMYLTGLVTDLPVKPKDSFEFNIRLR